MYGRVKSRMSLYKLTMTDGRKGKRTDGQKERLIGFGCPKVHNFLPPPKLGSDVTHIIARLAHL